VKPFLQVADKTPSNLDSDTEALASTASVSDVRL
jgi:hypothetical protein